MEAKRLRVGRLSSILAISLILLLGGGLVCSSVTAQKVGSLDKVEVKREGDAVLVLLSGQLPKDYIAFKDIGPLRIVVDLPATRPNVMPAIYVENGLINTITATTLDTSADIPSTRVEVGLDREAGFTASHTIDGIVISVEAPGAAPRKAEVKETPAAEAPAVEAPVPSPAPQISEQATLLGSLKTESGDQMSRVVVSGNGSLDDFNAFVLTNPARLVVDIKKVGSALSQKSYQVGGAIINRVRVGTTYRDKVRLVVDFSGDRVRPYNLIARDNTLTIEVGSNGKEVPSRIRALDYRVLDDGKAIVTIKTDHKPSYDIKRVNSNDLLMTLYRTTVPRRLRRPFNTSQFPSSAVNTFKAKPSRKKPGSVEMTFTMREMVPYHVAWVGDDLMVEFDPTDKPVSPAMVLPTAASAERMAEAAPREAAEPSLITATPMPPGARVVGGPLISLDLQGASLANVLRLLADLTDKNLVVEPGVKGKVTMKVNNVPWRQVLELVLKINNLGMKEDGNVIRIAKATKLHKEAMQVLKREEEARKAEQKRAKIVEDLGELTTVYLQVNYASAKEMSKKISEVKSKDGTLSVDTRTSTIIYRDYPKRIENAKAILERLDKPTAQVLIEARIVNASKNFTRRLGIQWGGSASRNSDHLGGISTLAGALSPAGLAVNVPPSAAFGGIGWTFSRLAGDTISSLSVAIQALENEGYGRVISSPKIITMDNQKASIVQGKQIPYPKQTEDGISTEFIAATLSLEVTPQVTPDNRVQMKIVASKDAPDFTNTVGGAPSIDTQSAETNLLVNDGDTVVIGGIVTRDDSTSFDKVPGFADVPILGWFFKSKTRVVTSSELLIFVSPRIVQL